MGKGDRGMPVRIGAEVRRMEQEEFGAVAYEVISHAFSIHKENRWVGTQKVRLAAFPIRLLLSHCGPNFLPLIFLPFVLRFYPP